MVGRWFFLVLGITALQESLSYSPIPVTLEEEWTQFIERLDDANYRLPVTTKPSHYEFSLTPYFDDAPEGRQFTFDGSVAITIHANVENVAEIVMHCKDLTIISAAVETTGSGEIRNIIVPEVNRVCENGTDFLRVQTSEPLDLTQNYIVKFEFTGIIQPGMRGFYRSFYHDSTGRRWMGTTQFQPGHARQAFPCYDEPRFKAHFDITIVRPVDFSPTISNMPIKESISDSGRVRETFHTTPLTSTYLLAFIVSHYVKIASNNDENRPFDIYARNNAQDKGDWALEIGELLLDAMEQHTNFSYYGMQINLDMKQAAIPDFSAGAMENWGLLTYREALILYDPRNTNHFYKQRVANIVSHEIAHMWFGNLVTCAWWDNLWLNEGFARFYQYFLTDSVDDTLGFATRFITEQLQVAMFSDSEDNAHPLTDPTVSDATSVSAHFSTITYAKGACILRMTQHLLGEATYVKGLRAYLNERQFDVAEPHHLFGALDSAAAEDLALVGYGGITIDQYFRTWSEKAGHPLLTVAINHRTGYMTVEQTRWDRNTGTSNYQSIWDIPITWTRGGAPDFVNLKPSQFITTQVTTIDRGTTGFEWVIFNKQVSGFYRVNYDSNTWILITRALRSAERIVIHEYNRAQIVNDVFSLARAGLLTYDDAFNIISFLQFEDQYAPWLAAIDGFSFLRRRLAHDADNLNKLYELIAELSEAIVARLGYADIVGEPFMDGLLRMNLMEFLCNVGHENCIAAGKQNFENWKGGAFIPANMRPWVYCVGLREGTAADFDIFWERFLLEDLASEQVVMLTAAGCTSNEASLHKFLSAIVAATDDVRPQDAATAYNNAVTGNEVNTLRVFNWIQGNIDAVVRTFGNLHSPLSNIAGRLINEADMIMFENWLDENRDILLGAYYNLQESVNTARANLRWSDERVREMAQYFENSYVDKILEDSSEESSEETTEPTIVPEESSEEDENVTDSSEEVTEPTTTPAVSSEEDEEVTDSSEEVTEPTTTPEESSEEDENVTDSSEEVTEPTTTTAVSSEENEDVTDSSEEVTEPTPVVPAESSEEDDDDSANIAALSIMTMAITLAINYML